MDSNSAERTLGETIIDDVDYLRLLSQHVFSSIFTSISLAHLKFKLFACTLLRCSLLVERAGERAGGPRVVRRRFPMKIFSIPLAPSERSGRGDD